jgi:hypothetical protein
MTKLKVVVLLAVVALLLFPALAFSAEMPPERPCRFYGTVQVDGVDVPAGTTIQAIIGGEVVGETTTTISSTTGGSYYGVVIVQPEGATYSGAAVTFKIGTKSAEQTGTWTIGENFNTDLSSGIPGPSDGKGEKGDKGDKGDTGDPGPKGDKGDPGEPGEDAAGGIALPVIALVIAIIAAGMAAMGMRRRV